MTFGVPKKRAIVVLIHPMARLYAAELVAYLSSTHEVKVVTYYRVDLLPSQTVDECRRYGADVVQFQSHSGIRKFLSLRKAGAQIRRWLSTAEDSEVFVCHPHHFLTNFLVFRKGMTADIPYTVNLIPDGLANYYLSSATPPSSKRWTKKLKGILLGLPFEHYEGDLLALQRHASCYKSFWYVSDEGIMNRYLPTKRFEVDRPNAPIGVRADTWLFVGQTVPSAGSKREYERILEAALVRSGGNIAYLFHPNESLDPSWSDRLTSMGFSLLYPDEKPAEEVALEYGPTVSVISSTIVNLKTMGWKSDLFCVTNAESIRKISALPLDECQELSRALDSLGIITLI